MARKEFAKRSFGSGKPRQGGRPTSGGPSKGRWRNDAKGPTGGNREESEATGFGYGRKARTGAGRSNFGQREDARGPQASDSRFQNKRGKTGPGFQGKPRKFEDSGYQGDTRKPRSSGFGGKTRNYDDAGFQDDTRKPGPSRFGDKTRKYGDRADRGPLEEEVGRSRKYGEGTIGKGREQGDRPPVWGKPRPQRRFEKEDRNERFAEGRERPRREYGEDADRGDRRRTGQDSKGGNFGKGRSYDKPAQKSRFLKVEDRRDRRDRAGEADAGYERTARTPKWKSDRPERKFENTGRQERSLEQRERHRTQKDFPPIKSPVRPDRSPAREKDLERLERVVAESQVSAPIEQTEITGAEAAQQSDRNITKQIWKASTLLSPVPVVMVTCRDQEGKANITTVAWGGTICSDPPMLSISLRPATHSHRIIKESMEFVVNVPSLAEVRATDYCGVVSGRDEDKFEKTGLTAIDASEVKAPLIAECPIGLECKVRQVLELGSHTMFIAEVVAVQVTESLIEEGGRFALEKAGLAAYAHGHYYALGKQLGHFGFSVRKKPTA